MPFPKFDPNEFSASGVGIEIRNSPDRVTWTRVGVAFPDGTPWATPYNNQTPPCVLLLSTFSTVAEFICQVSLGT